MPAEITTSPPLSLDRLLVRHVDPVVSAFEIHDDVKAVSGREAVDVITRQPVLFECSQLPHDMNSGHWCMLQNAADLASLTDCKETAAMLPGYVDHQFAAWADGRQSTEEIQHQRLHDRLAGQLDRVDLESLIGAGAALGSFEADILAGFSLD